MRRPPSNSVRAVALAVAFCALGIVVGCGQETFNLLPDAAPTAGTGLRAGAPNAAGAGGFGGGSPAGSGNAGSGSMGKAGAGAAAGASAGAGSGGVGGRFGVPPACLGEGGCPDEGPLCSPNAPFPCPEGQNCNGFTQRCAEACADNDDCADDKEHPVCHREFKVCVACNWDGDCTEPPNRSCFFSTCVQCFEDRQCPSKECKNWRCTY